MAETKGQNTQYGMLDIVKFLCAWLIVIAHYVSENASGRINSVIDNATSIYVIVVPFFFCSAGFLLFEKVYGKTSKKRKEAIMSYCKRILIMYLGWSFIYILFQAATWIRFGTTSDEIIRYIINSIFYSTYKTIWFLPALCIGVLVTYWFVECIGINGTIVLAVLFYIIGALGVSYSFLIDGNGIASNLLDKYNFIFVSTRNGLFNGFPFVAMGAWIACQKKKEEINVSKYFMMTAFWGVCFVAEAFVLKYKFHSINANTLLFLVPFTYFFVKLCLSIPMESKMSHKWMRKMSTTIFVSQRIFLSALPGLLRESLFASILKGNPYLGCAYVLIGTFLLAESLTFLSKRSRVLSVLC